MTVGHTRKRMEGQAVIVKDSLLTQQLGGEESYRLLYRQVLRPDVANCAVTGVSQVKVFVRQSRNQLRLNISNPLNRRWPWGRTGLCSC